MHARYWRLLPLYGVGEGFERARLGDFQARKGSRLVVSGLSQDLLWRDAGHNFEFHQEPADQHHFRMVELESNDMIDRKPSDLAPRGQ